MTGVAPTTLLTEWLAEATLEELVTERHFFDLPTASPCQRAFCRVFEGVPLGELDDDRDVRAMLACSAADLPTTAPFETTLLSGVRVAKSLIAAAVTVRWSQRLCVPGYVRDDEEIRVPVLSIDKDKAGAVLNHLRGSVRRSKVLQCLDMGDCEDGIILRHPTGRPIHCVVMAGHRAGGAVVAYWLGGCIFDEFPRMRGAESAVVNYDETRAGVEFRILPGGGVMNLGSPAAPEGPAYKLAMGSHGKPTHGLKAHVVMWAPAWTVNPVVWTPEVVEAARNDPDPEKAARFRTDVEAKFGTPEEAFFNVDQLEASVRRAPAPLYLARDPLAEYAAFIDPATRRNAFTLIIHTRIGNRFVVARAREWVGTRDTPLRTKPVMREVALTCREYGIDTIATDQFLADALREDLEELLDDEGKPLKCHLVEWSISGEGKAKRALHFKGMLEDRVELARTETWTPTGGWTETRNMVLDLSRVRRVSTPSGIAVKLPQTTDGRHCDFWPPVMMAMGSHLDDVKTPENETDKELQAMREAAERRASGSRGRGDDDDE